MNSFFADCEVISSYTRQQAIEDGVLIDISALYPDITRQLYKFPVTITSAVWGLIERAVSSKRHGNDCEGVIWDILWMSQRGIVKRIDESQHLFQVLITGVGRQQLHNFKIICHPGDHGEPVLTIMLPHED